MSIETTVNSNVSLVLVKNLTKRNIVYLPLLNTPNFSLTVRDITGSPSIQTNTVILSTINGAKFQDGSYSYQLNEPYGLVNVALRNSNIWQILHTSGQAPANSAANVETLNISTAYFFLQSTIYANISTLTVSSLISPNSIEIEGPVSLSNLSSPGYIVVQSNLRVYGQTTIDKNLYVSSTASFLSSVLINTLLPFSNDLFFHSSLGVASGLTVGGVTDVSGFLYTQSTIQMDTLQVQQSTTSVTMNTNTLNVGGLFSSLGSLNVGQATTLGGNLTILQNVSTSAFQTDTLSVNGETTIHNSLITGNFVTIRAALNAQHNIDSINNLMINTNLSTNSLLSTFLFSSLSLSTANASITGPLTISDSIDISGNTSSFEVYVGEEFSIGGSLYTNGNLSSLQYTDIKGKLFANSDATFQTLDVSGGVSINGSLLGNGNTYLDSAVFESAVTVLGSVNILSSATVATNVGIASKLFVNSNLITTGASFVGSIQNNSYLLSNLEITASTPTSFTASSILASTIYTVEANFYDSSLERSNVYASTIYTNKANVENISIENLQTNKFLFGPNANIGDFNFILNVDSLFAQGFSTIHVEASTFKATTFIGSHQGDGSGLSNVIVPYEYISGIVLLVSTASVENIFTSSFTASTINVMSNMYIQSSIVMPTLRIDSVGYVPRYDVNQILSLTEQSMVINNTLFVDSSNNWFGINISTPSVTLDISGVVYASNVLYSSINVNDLYLVNRTLSSVQSKYTYIEDSLQYCSSGLYVGAYYPSVGTGYSNFPLHIWDGELVGRSNYGFMNAPSTLVINSGLFLPNYKNYVGINLINYSTGSNVGTLVEPEYPLDVRGSIHASSGNFSTLTMTQELITPDLELPYFQLFGGNQQLLPGSTNLILTSATSFTLNQFVTFTKSGYTGINNITPNNALDVGGNSFFSTLKTSNLRVNTVALLYQDL
jgi:predicted acyltransferase (DUF342 family)